jgi:hypothetical protein
LMYLVRMVPESLKPSELPRLQPFRYVGS